MQLALNAYNEYLHTGEISSFGTSFQKEWANKIMAGEDWGGRKTNRFYGNLLETVDPEKYAKTFPGGEVTNDIWMARLFGLKSDVPTPKEYDAMTKMVQRIADQLGWEPKQVQAAMWIAKKARDEGTTIEEAGTNFAHALNVETGRVPFEAAPGAQVEPGLKAAYDALTPAKQRAYTAAKVQPVEDFL